MINPVIAYVSEHYKGNEVKARIVHANKTAAIAYILQAGGGTVYALYADGSRKWVRTWAPQLRQPA